MIQIMRRRKGPMQLKSSTPVSIASPIVLPLSTIAIALAIFIVDTFTVLDIAIAVLYVLVVVMAADFLPSRGVVLVSSACAALTILGYLISHGLSANTALVRCLVSLSAIGVAAVLTLKNQSANQVLREQAGLLDLTHDTIFVRDMNDVITYWNRGAEALYGWRAEQAIGKVTHKLLGTIFPVAQGDCLTSLLRADRWEGELVHSKRDGTQVVVSSRWSLLRNERGQPLAILETNTDITERKRTEDALRRSEMYLAEAQRLSLTGSFGWKAGSGDIFWSEQTYRIFCYDRTIKPTVDVILQRVHPDDVTLVKQMIDRASQGRQDIDFEHRLTMPDGSLKYVRVLAHAPPDASNHPELIGAVMDITATTRAQEALQEAQAELTHVTRVTTLGELTASIAHEVNQPLAGIVINGEASLRWLGHQTPDVDEVRHAVERIISDARRASDVIRRIRNLAKKATPEMVPIDVNEVIDDALLLVQRQVLNHRVGLQLELESGLPPVLGDRVQLQQVVINLVINGIEAMVHVTDRPRWMLVRSHRDEGGQVLVSVQDSGVGIDPENANRLFNAFYTSKRDGMGMGLSISRSIVEAHGGRIWATNNEGPGATIQFALPAYRDSERAK
jgi:PAS domain S-box-containing protein